MVVIPSKCVLYLDNALKRGILGVTLNVVYPWITVVVQSTTPRFPREKTARAPELLIASTGRRGTRPAVAV